ncbi:hypothetical protein, partial [Vibrio vulnificus]|uniref:hypothetical protein n=1 Tax=Vibrio vulnificus TaxID=672 RepID=UPI0039B68C11
AFFAFYSAHSVPHSQAMMDLILQTRLSSLLHAHYSVLIQTTVLSLRLYQAIPSLNMEVQLRRNHRFFTEVKHD